MASRAADLRAQWVRRAALGEVPATVSEPKLLSGMVLTPNIDVAKAPGLATLQVKLASGTAGVSAVYAEITSPSGTHSQSAATFLPAYPPAANTQTIKFDVPQPLASNGGISTVSFGLFAEHGAWTVSSLSLLSGDGQFVQYTGSQLAALFPNAVVNVANANTPDVTAPSFGTGKILTPTVSLGAASPYFAVRVAVTDDLSGVGFVSLGVMGPDGSNLFFQTESALTLPILNGRVVSYDKLQAGMPVGTYTISSLLICDIAENCASEGDPQQIEATFGTNSFQVTN